MTTILAVRKNKETCMIGDGQVSLGNISLKHTASKIRLLDKNKVIMGFAGTGADALTLFDRFKNKLEQFNKLEKAAMKLAQEWRSDKYLRRLEAQLLIVDKYNILILGGNGEILKADILDEDKCALSIGSGSPYALAAARALLGNSDLSAEQIATKSMKIAAELCIYTNDNFTVYSVK